MVRVATPRGVIHAQTEQRIRDNGISLQHSPNANAGLQSHQPVAFALWRVFQDFASLQYAQVFSVAGRQFERHPKLGDGHGVLDEAPARAALLVDAIKSNAAPPRHAGAAARRLFASAHRWSDASLRTKGGSPLVRPAVRRSRSRTVRGGRARRSVRFPHRAPQAVPPRPNAAVRYSASSSISRDVIRIALGSSGRSKNLRRSRTSVSILVIIPRPHAFLFRRLRGRSLCGGRSPVKGGLTAVASGDCSLDRVRASPCFASMQTTAGFTTYPSKTFCFGSPSGASRSRDPCADESGDASLGQSSVLLTGTPTWMSVLQDGE